MIKNKIYGLIGLARRAGKIAFGTESSIDTIKRKKAKLVIVAENCSDRTKKNFDLVCKEENVPIRVFGTIEELSDSIGQDNKAVIVIKDIGFSNEIIKKIDGGEIIG
ncbi:MAG: hypothetical protein GX682_01295 [Clostridiaceae bacterium]|nr:hypothetical protein [Clostridiaceae bacterium]